jgi:hypothetical protein
MAHWIRCRPTRTLRGNPFRIAPLAEPPDYTVSCVGFLARSVGYGLTFLDTATVTGQAAVLPAASLPV